MKTSVVCIYEGASESVPHIIFKYIPTFQEQSVLLSKVAGKKGNNEYSTVYNSKGANKYFIYVELYCIL